MSMLKKLKDVLFDTTEDDLPIITEKKERMQEESNIKEIIVPKAEEIVKKEPERTFDIDESLTKKRPSKGLDSFLEDELNIMPEKRVKQRTQKKFDYEPKKEKVKTVPFKPSPVISPVYGVLDQNYSKDDVVVKTSIGIKNPTLDDVREKAYGAEVDSEDIDKSLKSLDEILMSSDFEEETTRENKNEKSKNKTEEIIKEEKEISKETLEVDIENNKKEEQAKEIKDEKISNKDIASEEKDLYNLIDSMYEENGVK